MTMPALQCTAVSPSGQPSNFLSMVHLKIRSAFPTKTLSASTNNLTLKNGTGAVRADTQCPPALFQPRVSLCKSSCSINWFPPWTQRLDPQGISRVRTRSQPRLRHITFHELRQRKRPLSKIQNYGLFLRTLEPLSAFLAQFQS